MDEYSILANAVIYLTAAVVAVPISKHLGLGSVLGYLIGGVIIGPWGLGLIDNVESIIHFAEFGVVLLMFLIGLELHPKRLWELKRPILLLGGGQMILTSIAITAVGILLGLSLQTAVIVALALSLSSTAIALQSLTEKNLMATHAGGSAFSVLLFQDIAVIPILALITLLGVGDGIVDDGNTLFSVVKLVAVIAAIIIGGHYLTRPIFRIIANTKLREIFTAFALLLVIAIALLVESVGLSMAMGSFLAGVLLADSEFRHELEAEIEPFKGLLLGLFFIAVGMSIDIGLLLQQPFVVLGLVVSLVVIKLAILMLLAKREGIPESQQYLFSFMLCQGGEFAFVLFTLAISEGAIEPGLADLLVGVVALSMLITPLLLLFYDRYISCQHLHLDDHMATEEITQQEQAVMIVGFGRFGRVVGRLLHANGFPTTILDHDPEQIAEARRYGYEVFYGDSTRHDLLKAAGADKAELIIICLDGPEMSLQVIEQIQKHFPHL
ncbi:MAG: monovalent cation:proton antiporter-2 (CPA2) family protein, partial [Gammaproteobacteria bacterium]|nr:monovalent cation:proton antiporter-2 (CPA2) family protein [Gammaproteobacteria bacterium]